MLSNGVLRCCARGGARALGALGERQTRRKRYLLRSVSDLLKFSHMIVDTDLEQPMPAKAPSRAPTREPLCTAQARQPLSQPASAGSQMPVTKWLQLSNAEVGKVRALAPALRL